MVRCGKHSRALAVPHVAVSSAYCSKDGGEGRRKRQWMNVELIGEGAVAHEVEHLLCVKGCKEM